MSSYSRITSHQTMVFDDVRNSMYAKAIENMVRPDSVVLDLGAGLGVHGLIAAAAGAQTVYMVDPSPMVLMAEQIAEANRLSDRVRCYQSVIETADLPEKADLLISVFTGNFLLSEDLLPALFWTRDHYLKPGGRMIPERARMWVAPVSAKNFYRRNIEAWSETLHGLSFEKARRLACNSLFYDKQKQFKAKLLADPICINDIDLMTASEASCNTEVELTFRSDGHCHGWLGWMDIRLGDEWLSTGPDMPDTHWNQVLLPLEESLEVEAGQRIQFSLSRPEYGEWVWKTRHGGRQQNQSTFLSVPFRPSDLLKRSQAYRPSASDKGKAAHFVLSVMDGNLSKPDIVHSLCRDYPNLFIGPGSALRFVDELIIKYT